ncbi:MAG: NAD(P)-dependent oxidoreductase [Gammaproteobacteria bacterium]|nr:NAD(P)-dependent oxidoreductase [Gammaproteobacteria bacterium]
MHVLVTGVAGFIGKHLVNHLKDEGHTISGLDKLEKIDPDILSTLEDYNTCDLSGQELAQNSHKIDSIVHLAGEASVSEKNSRQENDNVKATKTLLEFAENNDINKIIFLSSEKVDTSNSTYAASKRSAEQMILKKSEASGLKSTIFRSSMVFGPGMKSNLIGFLKKIKHRKLLALPSSQSSVSMVGIHDLCRLICGCINNSQTDNKVYKVTDGRTYGINAIEQAVRKQFRIETPKLAYPKVLLYLSGKLGDLSATIGIKFPMNSNAYAMLFDNQASHDDSIYSDTGIKPQQNFFEEIQNILAD